MAIWYRHVNAKGSKSLNICLALSIDLSKSTLWKLSKTVNCIPNSSFIMPNTFLMWAVCWSRSLVLYSCEPDPSNGSMKQIWSFSMIFYNSVYICWISDKSWAARIPFAIILLRWKSLRSIVSPWLSHSSASATANAREGTYRSSLYIVLMVLSSRLTDQ